MNYEPIMGVPFSAIADRLIYLPVACDGDGGWLFVTTPQGGLKAEAIH